MDADVIIGNARQRGTCGTFWWSDPARKISPTHLHNSERLKCGGLCATQKNTQRLEVARYQIAGNPLKEVPRVDMRDRQSRGDDCATSGRFSKWNEEQGPHPETSVSDRGLGTGGLVHAQKGSTVGGAMGIV